ncbi:hypothetical protein [Mesorhizobium sp. SP-1A]|jgi:hypothetical protein|uniref:hypothetical protein n=1 Tax=Mesorhizobium sp. SP-1A TaxID=3077840 RepID=UPI0028F6E86E|nr:hypothetical protein [Mesorhizobium sp. SP-1A]
MDRDTRNAAIAALIILVLFGLFAYWLPTIMLAAGSVSSALAVVVMVLFLFSFFAVLWLRSRAQRRKGER